MPITLVRSPWCIRCSRATPIYSTAPTAFFTQIMPNNALKVMETNGEALFKQETLELSIQQMHQSLLKTETWYPLWDGWQVMFILSGHILGAVSIVLDTPEGKFLYIDPCHAIQRRLFVY